MNAIRQTQLLNKRELENAIPPSASWHADYRDTAWVYIGGLPMDLTEGDVVTICSQYGNPTHLNMIRDKETGKSKGFAFLKYEDQRSCDLAVDNLGGAEVLGRLLRVDHTRYKKKEGEDEETYQIDRHEAEAQNGAGGKRASEIDDSEEETHGRKKKRPLLKEEKELEEMLAITQDGEEEDPMREYLLRDKREEVERAKQKEERKHRKHRDRGHDDRGERRHRHSHQSVDEHDKERGERHRYQGKADADEGAEGRSFGRDRDGNRENGGSRRRRDDGDPEDRKHRHRRRGSPEDDQDHHMDDGQKERRLDSRDREYSHRENSRRERHSYNDRRHEDH